MGETFNRIEVKKPLTDASREHDITDRPPTQEELLNVPSLTDAEYRAILKTEDFKNSPLVQKLAQVGRQKGVAEEIALEDQRQAERGQHDAVERIGNRAEAEFAAGRKLFTDPRYKKDASFRMQVAQQIAATQSTEGEGGTHRLTMGKGTPGQVVQHQRSGVVRVSFPVKTTGADVPSSSKEPFKGDPGVVDLYNYK